jgi:hypothetical protein
MAAGDLTSEREERITIELLRERVGIDPDKVMPVVDLAAIGLVNGAWRNTCIENWHAEGRLEDGGMLRANSHATWRVRQLMRRWARGAGQDADAPASAFDRITAEQVWQLADRLYAWLTSPVRKIPGGMTLAQLAGDGLAEYRDDADVCLTTFAVQAEKRGARFGFARPSGWWTPASGTPASASVPTMRASPAAFLTAGKSGRGDHGSRCR